MVKTNNTLLIGGLGIVALLLLTKKSSAATVLPSTPGVPQPSLPGYLNTGNSVVNTLKNLFTPKQSTDTGNTSIPLQLPGYDYVDDGITSEAINLTQTPLVTFPYPGSATSNAQYLQQQQQALTDPFTSIDMQNAVSSEGPGAGNYPQQTGEDVTDLLLGGSLGNIGGVGCPCSLKSIIQWLRTQENVELQITNKDGSIMYITKGDNSNGQTITENGINELLNSGAIQPHLLIPPNLTTS